MPELRLSDLESSSLPPYFGSKWDSSPTLGVRQRQTYRPPFTLICWPVMHPSSSEQRNSHAAAMSSGCLGSQSGIRLKPYHLFHRRLESAGSQG